MTVRRIDAGEIRMAYELSGPASTPVVCLNHCFGSDLRYWDRHLSAFEGFRVLRYDTRGPWRKRCATRAVPPRDAGCRRGGAPGCARHRAGPLLRGLARRADRPDLRARLPRTRRFPHPRQHHLRVPPRSGRTVARSRPAGRRGGDRAPPRCADGPLVHRRGGRGAASWLPLHGGCDPPVPAGELRRRGGGDVRAEHDPSAAADRRADPRHRHPGGSGCPARGDAEDGAPHPERRA